MDVKSYGIPIVWICRRSLTAIGSAIIAAFRENRIHVPFNPTTAVVLAIVLRTEELAVSKDDIEVSTKPMIPAGHKSGNQSGIEFTLIWISLMTMRRVLRHICGDTDRGMRQIDVNNTLGNVGWKLQSFMAQVVDFARPSQLFLIIDRVIRCPPGRQHKRQKQQTERALKN